MTTLKDLYRFAETEQVEIIPFDMQLHAMSLMDEEGNCYVAINPRRAATRAEKKVKVAHELGHCATGAFYSVYAPHDLRRRHENRADKWAVKKLIPREELQAAVEAGHVATWDLADLFDVPEDLMRRAITWYQCGYLPSE